MSLSNPFTPVLTALLLGPKVLAVSDKEASWNKKQSACVTEEREKERERKREREMETILFSVNPRRSYSWLSSSDDMITLETDNNRTQFIYNLTRCQILFSTLFYSQSIT